LTRLRLSQAIFFVRSLRTLEATFEPSAASGQLPTDNR
jgi:hypothetical protein